MWSLFNGNIYIHDAEEPLTLDVPTCVTQYICDSSYFYYVFFFCVLATFSLFAHLKLWPWRPNQPCDVESPHHDWELQVESTPLYTAWHGWLDDMSHARYNEFLFYVFFLSFYDMSTAITVFPVYAPILTLVLLIAAVS